MSEANEPVSESIGNQLQLLQLDESMRQQLLDMERDVTAGRMAAPQAFLIGRGAELQGLLGMPPIALAFVAKKGMEGLPPWLPQAPLVLGQIQQAVVANNPAFRVGAPQPKGFYFFLNEEFDVYEFPLQQRSAAELEAERQQQLKQASKRLAKLTKGLLKTKKKQKKPKSGESEVGRQVCSYQGAMTGLIDLIRQAPANPPEPEADVEPRTTTDSEDANEDAEQGTTPDLPDSAPDGVAEPGEYPHRPEEERSDPPQPGS